ncbi:hypothetical protein AYO38_04605 [bacterium SCGC AG-212-C10]|nr:hypothetical protein AYO38_04605 [bacterium SCGC AG-212-C10]
MRVGPVMLLVLGVASGLISTLTAEPADAGVLEYRLTLSGLIASDGPLPTPSPTPTPAIPEGIAHCYAPRAEDQGGFVLQPAGPKSVLQSCQVVGYYGYPGVSSLGVLSQSDPGDMIARLRSQAADFDATNGPRGVIIAFHLIAAVAQYDAGADGHYLYRMPDSLIREWIDRAAQANAIVILDIQMGTSTIDEEIGAVLPYLDSPYVHLALDPEWTMPAGVRPGTIIGSMDGSAINRAQQLMSDYLVDHHLSDRMLLIHQFTDGMITNKTTMVTYPAVDLVIDTDGFGYASQKIGNYNRYIAADGAPHGGMKLFYRRDIDLMTPAEVSALVPQPDFITYE